MGRRRNLDIQYQLEVKSPLGDISHFLYDNFNDMASGINRRFFSGFNVVTDTMISNWVHYPLKARRDYARAFEITKIKDITF